MINLGCLLFCLVFGQMGTHAIRGHVNHQPVQGLGKQRVSRGSMDLRLFFFPKQNSCGRER